MEEGRLGGVGLDVTWDEPADPNEPLYRHPKVITLPHLGCATEEAYDALARVLCHNIVAVHDHDASAPAAQPPKLLHAL